MNPWSFQPRQVFILTLFSGVLAALYWASEAKVDVIVRAEGRVVPAGKPQIVQHLEGGIVRKLNVSEGQRVKAGEALVELSDIQAKSTLGRERTTLDALRGKEARLLAESQGLAGINFPKNLADQDVKNAELAAFRARRARLSEEIRVLRDQNGQKRGEISEADSRRRSLMAELDVAKQQYRVIEGLSRENAASHLELLESQSRIQKLSTQISEAESAIPRLRSAASETDSRASEVWARFRAEASSELTQVRSDIERSSMEINSNTDRLDRNIVRAPVSGFVNRLVITTIGGVVRPGEALMEITPAEAGVMIEAKSQPNDRANLHSGLPARVRIGAYDYASYGALDGKVTEVSADTLMDERETRYYRIVINATGHQTQAFQTVPGMTAVADIVVGKRTVLSYLLSPLLKFKDRAFRDPR